MATSTERTDVHRPSFLDPAEYTEVGYFDLHHEDGGGSIDEGYSDKDSFLGNFAARGRCDHCGAGPLRYIVIFHHAPTDKIVTVGTRCAGVLGLPSRSERERRAAVETARRNLALATFRADARNDAVYLWLVEQVEENGNHGYGGFYHDLLSKCRRYGNLTENQVAAVERARDRDAEFAARRAAEAATIEGPLTEGRREIAGEIVSTKWQDSDFGGAMKMLVREDDGNKVWGTIPAALEAYDADTGSYSWPDKGARIVFTATVTRSDDDEHFGFFKRPTNARVEGATV